MADYNYVINLFSLLLLIGILFTIMYGCQFQKNSNKNIERFLDLEEYERLKENEQNIENTSKNIAEKIKTDNLSAQQLAEMVENGTIKKEEIEHMINYIENFENEIKQPKCNKY